MFAKERVRCVQSMLPKKIKQVPARQIRELVVSTEKMINLIRRKGGVYPVMSQRLIVTGRKIVLPSYLSRSYMYGVKVGTTNSIDNMRTFLALNLRLLNTTFTPCRDVSRAELLKSRRSLFQWTTT